MKRKQALVDSAIHLFATNGFDATTTASIAIHAGVTEPLIHYHFKNKDGLFAHILQLIFTEYFSKLDALPKETETEFDKVANLIQMNLRFAKEFPDRTFIVTSACPAKLQDAAHLCSGFIKDQGKKYSSYLTTCLKKGMASGEFKSVSLKATPGILLALINGVMRRKSLKLERSKDLEASTIEFCRSALCSE
jgi:AcrR family transcriptional regulator